ncbi:exosortase V [Sandaracinobacteroides saxicola]|uniref:Exosortase V n=1 Tax=Sandaracinobacteroides saxicola TaxID=2759707 RepID=A0A7G5IFB9_9SPHN|nr:exosortase V [Sandaracinobacteroides saxicola]QMW22061.1 exosortase V [Sandaracinobacteroides saxicola]
MAGLARIKGSSALAHARRFPLLTLALLAVVIPTLLAIATQSWSTEAGVHGPLVLATALWLIWRRWDEIVAEARPGNLWLGLAVLLAAAGIYAFGRAFNFLSVEVGAMLLALLAIAYVFVGHRLLLKLWFPILYMGFVVPLPGWFVDGITQPLKILVSEWVTWLLATAGYPIARIGVTLYIAQYQLLVEDACAGLNSIISLTAIGLFYIYLLYNASARYALLLLLFVIPVAVVANVIRVIGLVLITYYFGDAAAQGYLHNFAGIVTFVSALLTIFAVDWVLSPLRRWLSGDAREGGVA